jgi:transcriptional regulator with XRE-family HTH domain
MGIFFDQDWFDARLKASGLTRASLAQAAGMTVDEVEMVFSDRRELEQGEMKAIARVLRVDANEIATRSGAASIGESGYEAGFSPAPSRRMAEPAPEFQVTREVIAGLHERIDRLERLLEVVIAKLDRR